MSKYWLCLFLAGLCEIGWPIGLKISQTTSKVALGIALAVASMAVSGYMLWIAQKQIPIGTAYAVWTGIGAAGTFVVGVLVFGDPSSLWRWVGVALIIGGVVVLKLAGGH
ncbi:DMT family transporter [Cerasicoccus frondis]|uniref:DMT family transporter n=1 Tax=Cerasicoccus frondis TaxID=490090 RepID=UPI0028526EAF|nr:multidrug efflux SMR transporter [Cerasicoccus frondis]